MSRLTRIPGLGLSPGNVGRKEMTHRGPNIASLRCGKSVSIDIIAEQYVLYVGIGSGRPGRS